MATSDKEKPERSRAITVRVPAGRLQRVMRGRRSATQSELINTLLSEEEERLNALRVLRETEGSADSDDFDDRLL
jgi:hypothetical protein